MGHAVDLRMLLRAELDLAVIFSSVWAGVRLDAEVSEFIVAPQRHLRY
jgi:hypothetical protein